MAKILDLVTVLALLNILAMSSGLSCWLDKNSLINLFITSCTGRKSNRILGKMVANRLASERRPFRILESESKSRSI